MSALHDTLTREGAAQLARRIEEYWLRQKRYVQVSVTTVERPPRWHEEPVYFVRSDMVNGMPRKVLAVLFCVLCSASSFAQAPSPVEKALWDEWSVGSMQQQHVAAAINAVLSEHKREIADWRATFQAWCGDRPACGLESKK